ncbi:MAG TPA: hypothetical protein DET40_26085 [Lentisphaeria bacterium]|nr:MAG: hypothetical protein A2X45_12835 [Lentisphaerae bacterium GWF2_50_93]HCE47033.1 hypothetical protein [Lentisphaeria bacterium]
MPALIKENMMKIIEEQPDDSSFDEILRELAFSEMIDKGLDESKNKRIISNEDMKRETAFMMRLRSCSICLKQASNISIPPIGT